MAIDTIGGHESAPKIKSFLPSIDSMEKPQKQLQNKNGHESIYDCSIASCDGKPLWSPGKDSVVESLSVRGGGPPPVETQRGFFDSISGYASSAFDKIINTARSVYDTVYTYIWGVSPYANAQAASEAAMSEMQRKRISDAIDAMIKALERIQEVAKEEGTEETASEDKKRFFSFIEIMKNDAIILKKQLADNAEAINALHKATRDNHKKSREARGSMHDAAANAAIANGFLSVSSFFAAVAGLFNAAEALGYTSSLIPPLTPYGAALIAVGRAGAILAMGASGASKLAKTSFENKRIKHDLEIEVLKIANQKNDNEVKNLSQDMSTINQNIAIPDSYISELIKSLESLKNSMLDYK